MHYVAIAAFTKLMVNYAINRLCKGRPSHLYKYHLAPNIISTGKATRAVTKCDNRKDEATHF